MDPTFHPDDFDAAIEQMRPTAERMADQLRKTLKGDAVRDELARLAALSFVEYEIERKEAARRLSFRASELDKAVAELRRDPNGATAETSALTFDPIDPWPAPVNGAALIEQLVGAIQSHVILPPVAADVAAAWVIFAHSIDAFDCAPRLAILSPEKRCGKTRLLEVLFELTPRALLASNISPAALFRIVEAARPTLLIDEADAFMRDNEDLRGLVNSGHTRRSVFAVRCTGEDNTPRKFSTWTAMAIGAIGRLPGTIEDRSIVIRMKRKLTSNRVERLTSAAQRHLHDLARKTARWVSDNIDALAHADPPTPAGLNDRATDNCRPLFGIADLAGGDWPSRLRAAALALSGSDGEVSESLRVALLRDIKSLFDADSDRERYGSTDLCAKLAQIETAPWASLTRGKPLSTARLARMLRDFEVYVREDAAGSYYRPADFDDTFRRYLPDVASCQSATVPEPTGAVRKQKSQSATTKMGMAL